MIAVYSKIPDAVFSPFPTCDHITSNRESGFFHLSPAGPDQLAAEFYCYFTGIEAGGMGSVIAYARIKKQEWPSLKIYTTIHIM